MDKNDYLIDLSESDRTDFGRTDFNAQSPDQKVFSAVWALESEVNNGGFAGYFGSWDGDTASFVTAALEQIGAPHAASIVRRALAAVSPGPLPDDHDEREALIEDLTDAQLETLDELNSEFYGYPDNLTEALFGFVATRPDSFGMISDDD